MATRPTIGLWGWYGAGKTSYLVALYSLIAKTFKSWQMYPLDQNSEDFVETAARPFLPTGYFPRPTSPGQTDRYSFMLEWQEGRRSHRQCSLDVIDAAGRDATDPADPAAYFREVGGCEGLLCLIEGRSDRSKGMPRPIGYEGQGAPEPYHTLLQRLFDKAVNRRPRDSRPFIAFGITKVDLDDCWQTLNEHQNAPDRYAEAVLGAEAVNLVKNTCGKRYRVFGISAAGRYDALQDSGRQGEKLERPNYEPAGDTFKIANMGQWQPRNIWEPLEWLIKSIDDERMKRQAQEMRARRGRRLLGPKQRAV